MNKFNVSPNEVQEVVNHLRTHEQYQPELIQKKIEPWIKQLEECPEVDVATTIAIIREAVMLGLKEIEAQTYCERYQEAHETFMAAQGVQTGKAWLINDEKSLKAHDEYLKKYMAAYHLFHETNLEFAGFPLKRESDKEYSPAERNMLWAALAEYQSGRVSVRLARTLRFRKACGEPVSIYPSDHRHSVVSMLANVYGVDVDSYLAAMEDQSKDATELEIENTKLDLGIKHKTEREVIEEGLRRYSKYIEPKN